MHEQKPSQDRPVAGISIDATHLPAHSNVAAFLPISVTRRMFFVAHQIDAMKETHRRLYDRGPDKLSRQ